MNYDIVVAGGGPAGIGAAIAAARNGAKTLLVEGTNCLGGMLTNGLVGMIRTAGDNGGIVREFWDRLVEVDGAEVTDSHAVINPCVGRIVALEMTQGSLAPYPGRGSDDGRWSRHGSLPRQQGRPAAREVQGGSGRNR